MANSKKPKSKSSSRDNRDEDYKKTRKGKGNRRYNESSSDSKSDTTKSYPYSNDPGWWNKMGQLSKDATTFSFANATGAKLPGFEYGVPYFTPAGIARYDYLPCFGTVDSSVHPINVSAKILYDTINSKNSRNMSYDPSDLMIYVVAVANAWAVHAWIQRLVGMYNTFSPTNRYWWQPIAKSMGISPVSVSNDIVKWRFLANTIALNLSRLAVPDGIDYFKRCMYPCNAIYADAPINKASFFYFSPSALFKYVYDAEGKSKLVLSKCPWFENSTGSLTEITPADVESYFWDLTSNLFNDTDINTIGADIIKAYGLENCFTLPQIDESYKIGFAYDPWTNLQLHNARMIYNPTYPINNYQVTQNMEGNYLQAKFSFPTYPGGVSTAIFKKCDNDAFLEIPWDFPTDIVTNDMVIEATRFMYYWDEDDVRCCTELLVRDTEFFFDTDDEGEGWELTFSSENVVKGIPYDGDKITQMKRLIDSQAILSKFGEKPLSYVAIAGNSSGQFLVPEHMRCVSDVSNYGVISRHDLETINNTCTQSIFYPTKAGLKVK